MEEAFNLSDLIENLLTMTSSQIKDHHHSLSVNISGVIHEAVLGDSLRIQKVFTNLMSNAVKYTPDGGRITLGLKRERNQCVLSVTDTGKGISAEELPRIFDRFYRCDETRQSQTSGHGLGLSIARIIVTAHGGKLKVRSKVGAGTTFSVLLPLETT